MFQKITLKDFINVCVGFGYSLNWGNGCSRNILLASFSVLPEVCWCRASSGPTWLPSVIHSLFDVSSLLQFTRNELPIPIQNKNIPVAFSVGTKYEISSRLVRQYRRRMRTSLRCTNAIYVLFANLSHKEVFHPVWWEIPSPKGIYFFPVCQCTII
jgi:hypothetical protein